jgi:hypothetical protein
VNLSASASESAAVTATEVDDGVALNVTTLLENSGVGSRLSQEKVKAASRITEKYINNLFIVNQFYYSNEYLPVLKFTVIL